MIFLYNFEQKVCRFKDLCFFYTYFKGIFAILTICIQITLSLYRLLIVTNKNTSFIKKHKLILTIMLVFSVVFYSPLIFTKQIIETVTNVTIQINGTIKADRLFTYSSVNNFIGNSNVGKWLIIFVGTIFRGFLSLSLISGIGMFTLWKLKQQIITSKI